MAANPGWDESNSTQFVQEAAQAAREAARRGADQANRIGRATAEVNSQAARAGADILGRNVEAAHHVLQSGAEMAAKLTERSAHQFGRVLGFTGDDAEKAAQSYSTNLGAILESSATLAEMTQEMTREWLNFGRERLERNFENMDHLLHSRTPQDVLAVQSQVLRDNLEGFLGCARRVAERSMRTTEVLTRKFDQAAEQSRHAA
jgi:hypothetical protein